MPRSLRLTIATLAASALAAPLLAQPTDQCGPAAPLLTFNIPLAGDNSAAQTDAFIDSSFCGGFNGSGGYLDVFARFIPPTSGVYRFATCGSPGDTVVSVHTACPVTDQNLVGCNDDDCDTQSRIDVRLTAGVEYHVRIASNGDNLVPGPFDIVVTQLTPPANDECSAAITVAPGSSTAGTNTNATGNRLSECVPDGKDVWYSLPITTTGLYVIDTLSSDHPDTVLGVWTGCPGAGGTELTCNDNDGFSNQARTAIVLQSGQTYLVRVSGRRGFSGQPAEGDFVLNVSTRQTPLANDHCANATPIAPGATVNGDTSLATLGTTSVQCADNDFYDAWYALSVPVRAQYVVSLQPTGDFDAVLSALETCSGPELACSNQFGAESITIVIDPSTPVLLRVAGQFHSRGQFTLSVDSGTPIPLNDDCANASPIGVGQTAGTNRAATGTDLTPSCAFDDSADVWYRFTAPSAGLYTFDTNLSTSLTDTTLSLFTACGVDPLVCNDNAGSNADPADFTSRVSLPMTANQQVLVRVAGMGASVGEFILRASGPTAAPAVPSNDTCEGARPITGLSYTDSVDARFATNDIGSECIFGDVGETHFGVWYIYTAVESGVFTLAETGPMQASVTGFQGACGDMLPLSPLQCSEITLEVAAGDTFYFLIGSEGTEAPAAPYVVTANLRPQLGCCASGSGCAIVPQSACTGTWTESLCGTATTAAGATSLPLSVPNPATNNNPVFVTSTLQSNDTFTLSNLSISVNLAHASGSDVVLRLITPWGATIPLITGAGSLGAFVEGGEYRFSDIGLRTMAEVYNGEDMPFRTYPAPSSIGSVVSGHSVQGTWTLSVGDDRRSNATGRVDAWSITFHGACSCPADLGTTGGVPGADGLLNNNDFVVFIDYFFAQDPRADKGSQGGVPGPDGQFNNNDFVVFIDQFFTGCG